MNDDVAGYNRQRWDALVHAGALFTRPWLDLDVHTARLRLDCWGMLGEPAGQRVLCLAGGGGQQSAALALLGAEVTVLDLSEAQLEQDRRAAAHYEVSITTRRGDMRDLSAFADDAFDMVWQPYSLNFVPDCRVVFAEVARVLRPDGLYHFVAANPFAAGMGPQDWTGEGYLVRRTYVEEAPIVSDDPDWVFPDAPEDGPAIEGPREYRQTLGRLLNGLSEHGLVVVRMEEWAGHRQNLRAAPGSWEHLTAHLPPWLWFWTRRRA